MFIYTDKHTNDDIRIVSDNHLITSRSYLSWLLVVKKKMAVIFSAH